MKPAALLFFIQFLFFICSGEAVSKTIRFGPLPMEKQETVLNRFRPLTEYLTDIIKFPIEYVYTDNYEDLLEKFRKSEIDLAYLGPLPYVKLRQSFSNAEPVVVFKESPENVTYTCALVTFPDNNFDFFMGEYQKIALTQPLSTCGYLSVNGLMREHGKSLEQNYYRYLGTHDNVALSVIRGEYDAGGLKTKVARRYAHMGLYILMETPPLPAFALVANTKTLSGNTIAGIQAALLDRTPQHKQENEGPQWDNVIGNGVVKADDTMYETIRKLLGEMAIPQEGNF